MKIGRPSPTTVIACLALFVALAGSAIAARDQLGAKEIKQLNVRQKKRVVSASSSASDYQVSARCTQNEQFMGGGGGWLNQSSGLSEQPAIRSELAIQKFNGGPPKGYFVTGSNPAGFANTLVVQAYCLPK
jgi:hypothetical protein